MIWHRGVFVVALGLCVGSARADRVAWLDETWTVEEYVSTFDQATSELWFYDSGVSFRADIPADPASDLIESFYHSVTATIARDFQVAGPGPGLIELIGEVWRRGGILPGQQGISAEMDIYILSQEGTEVARMYLITDHPSSYTESEDYKDEMLNLALDPGTYTFRVAMVTSTGRAGLSQYPGVAPFIRSEALVQISGIEPPVGGVVPEPSALALAVVGLGAAGLLGLRRRRPRGTSAAA